jgi:hypothetical protein
MNQKKLTVCLVLTILRYIHSARPTIHLLVDVGILAISPVIIILPTGLRQRVSGIFYMLKEIFIFQKLITRGNFRNGLDIQPTIKKKAGS